MRYVAPVAEGGRLYYARSLKVILDYGQNIACCAHMSALTGVQTYLLRDTAIPSYMMMWLIYFLDLPEDSCKIMWCEICVKG